MLDKLDKSKHNEQLLMMLHGPPGTGKTFLIKRLRDITNIEMRITATSGVAAMSLNGTTIDHFLAKGFRKRKKTKIETVRKNVGKATLLVLDEVSMMGSKKLLDLDKTLQKVNKTTAPFGGLDVIVVGDFAQLPAVKQTPLIESMVRSTLLHTPPTELTLKTTALMSMFVRFDLEEFKRSDTCTELSSLLRRLRNSFSGRSTFTLKDVKRIGVLNNETFTRDKKFRDASFLVATRKEKDAVISFAGKKWSEDHCRPMYWWYARPVSFKGCSEDADVIAEGMHQKCFASKEYYIEGCGATLKHNIAPASGYANGTKGIVVGLVHKDGYVMPGGGAGEIIEIEPPEYVILQVTSDDGTKTLVPCKRQVREVEYRFNGKEKKYRCMSNRVCLSFAQTVHEVQGQTLDRVILILGRHGGRCVGKITWSLLYVALSRVKKLEHIRFFPCGRISSYDCFKHLTKLKPSSTLVRWSNSYRNHFWDPAVLQQKQTVSEKTVESKLSLLGRDIVLVQKNEIIFGYLKDLNYGNLRKLTREPMVKLLNKHMVKKRLWEPTDDAI